jgi:hypothetical protein
MEWYLNWWVTTVFMTVLTVYALFGDDMRLLWSPKVKFPIIFRKLTTFGLQLPLFL